MQWSIGVPSTRGATVEYPGLEHVPRNLLTDRVRNLPRFEDYNQYLSLYLGFGLVGLVYGGLHCLAWNAPFASTTEKLFWRLSSVVVAASGLLVVCLSLWQIFPPFWHRGVLQKMWRIAKPFLIGPLLNGPDWIGQWVLAEELYTDQRQWYSGSWSSIKYWTHTLAVCAGLLVYVLVYILCSLCSLIPLAIPSFVIFLKVLLDIATLCFVPFYFLARAYLVIISFINLAHLPESAYHLPLWSQYIPHIG